MSGMAPESALGVDRLQNSRKRESRIRRKGRPRSQFSEPAGALATQGCSLTARRNSPDGSACFGSRVITVRFARRFFEILDSMARPEGFEPPTHQILSLVLSIDRLQARGIGCASIDRDDEEVSETQSLRCCRFTGSRAAKFGSRDATADSLCQQRRRAEAWRPVWLGRMVWPGWSLLDSAVQAASGRKSSSKPDQPRRRAAGLHKGRVSAAKRRFAFGFANWHDLR